MIVFLENSNLLSVASGIILHGCNAQGVMGSGVAKQLRAKYPQIYEDYQNFLALYRELFEEPALGKVCYTPVTSTLTVASGITQNFYGRQGLRYVSYAAIVSCIESAVSTAKLEQKTLHIPYMIGAGLGGGDLNLITELVEAVSLHYSYDIVCHKLES
jgi:O-acetyl-ADP-ribose deacetylase (regulator of RNase III)